MRAQTHGWRFGDGLIPTGAWRIAVALVLSFFLASRSGLAASGPGGVGSTDGTSALRLWLRSDVGAEQAIGQPASSGSSVQFWRDQSGYSVDASQSTVARRPQFVSSVLNGATVPVLRFDGTADGSQGQYLDMAHFMNFNNSTIYTVGYLTGGSQGMAFTVGGHGYSPVIQLRIRTGSLWYSYRDSAGTYLPWSYPAASGMAASIYSSHLDGNNLKVFSNATLISDQTEPTWVSTTFDKNLPPRVGRDASITNYNLTGDLAEIIVFDRPLTPAEKVLVDNALSAKYNIPLTAGDLYAGDAPAKGDYDRDVFGIGQGASGPAVSASLMAGFGLADATSSLAPNTYLLAGHKTPVNGLTTGDLPGDETARWERVWYVDRTGAVDALLTFSFDPDSGLAAPDPETTFSLLYSSVNAFDWSVLGGRASLLSGDLVTFTVPSSQLADGYYTLAYNPIPEPGAGLLLLVGGLLLAARRRTGRNR